jgi:hypothetical protein
MMIREEINGYGLAGPAGAFDYELDPCKQGPMGEPYVGLPELKQSLMLKKRLKKQ